MSPPPGNDHADLEYVNSELTLSLSQNVPSPIETHGREMVVSPPDTTPSSRSASQRGSLAPSPEQRDRGESSRSHLRQSSGPGNCTDLAPSTYLHSDSTASRNLHTLVNVTVKPLTSLSASFALPTRHHAQAPLPTCEPAECASATIPKPPAAATTTTTIAAASAAAATAATAVPSQLNCRDGRGPATTSHGATHGPRHLSHVASSRFYGSAGLRYRVARVLGWRHAARDASGFAELRRS